MKVSLIAAMAENRVIGAANRLPWSIPEDMKFFREKTKGHPVVMGRLTFESIGSKPLPGRENWVVSRSGKFSSTEGINVAATLEEALQGIRNTDQEVFIIGGGQIYQAAMAVADKIYLTLIHRSFEGDSFFPEVPDTFKQTAADRREGPIPFTFLTYERN